MFVSAITGVWGTCSTFVLGIRYAVEKIDLPVHLI